MTKILSLFAHLNPASQRSSQTPRAHYLGCALAAVILLAGVMALAPERAASQGANTVTTLSAASYGGVLAPESIAAAFGPRLTTREERATTTPLPTSLGGTTVRVRDSAGVTRDARLFGVFVVGVGATQVNFLVPAGVAAGAATVTITNSNNIVSTGTVQIAAVAPAIFSANATGMGVASAVALRVRQDNSRAFEEVEKFDPLLNRRVSVPLQLGLPTDQVFLLLYGSGIRGHGDLSRVTARIGGELATVTFAGPTEEFAGLDQLNILVPRSLIGRGLVDVAINVNGVGAANLVQLEIGAPPDPTPPAINFSATPVLVNDLFEISGGEFGSTLMANIVRMGGIEAPVSMAFSNRLIVRVPFGVKTGPISVRTPQGETLSQGAPLRVRTSISGRVEQTNDSALAGVMVTASPSTGPAVTRTTDAEGVFILPDVTANQRVLVRFQRPTQDNQLPFPEVVTSLNVQVEQDNPLPGPVPLQSATGPELQLPPTPPSAVTTLAAAANAAPAAFIQTEGIVFEVPDNVMVRFLDGSTSGKIQLTRIINSRAPFNLPAGIFSSTIAQLTPFGARLTPGGKLTFPNNDGLPAGSQARLFRFDQLTSSPTLGQFVDAGAATVSADGQRVETAAGAITETSIYFVARPSPITTVVGRVVENDGVTPVRLAVARSQGQEVFTDGNGGFALRNVAVRADGMVVVEASYLRPGGRVDRTERRIIPAIVNGITLVTPALRLPAVVNNRPPLIIGAPTSININEGQTRDFTFEARDPDANQTAQPTLSGPAFVSLVRGANNLHTLRVVPGFGSAGSYTLTLAATDGLVNSAQQQIALTVNRANPTPGLSSLNPSVVTAGSQGLTLNVSGGNFVNGAVVRWNGSNRVTNFVNVQVLTAAIPAADLAAGGIAAVTVFNPAPGGGLSNALNFTVNNPAPTLSSLSPNAAQAGGPAFTLALIGTGFTPGSVVRWNGANRTTTFLSAVRLTASIPASDIARPGSASVTVFNPTPGGGVTGPLTFTVANPNPGTITTVSAASFSSVEVAVESLVISFGNRLATSTVAATSQPLPTTLGGTTVRIKDSKNVERLAPLSQVSPSQVNYQIPTSTAVGTATITIVSGDGATSTGVTQIVTVAPGLFSANGDGKGVAVGNALRVKPDGSQTFEPLSQLDPATNRFVPRPIDLGPQNEQVFLILFATGIRLRNSEFPVTARIGGVAINVTNASSSGSSQGLDQVNLGPIPRSLIGKGVVDIVLVVENKTANIVQVQIK